MNDYPVYLRILTENEQPLFERHNCAEVVIGAALKAQQSGYARLHGFVVLPESLDMVVTPLDMSVSALVGAVESETIPLLGTLLPHVRSIWNRYFMRSPLETQRAFDARLNILLQSPVARGLAVIPEAYAYSSANPRYFGVTSVYTGFQKASRLPETAPLRTLDDESQETSPASTSHDNHPAIQSES